MFQGVQHQFHIRVYYADTDAGGWVYNSNYMTFFEKARSEMLREYGVSQSSLLAQDVAFVVRRSEIDFQRAAKFEDLLTITTQIMRVKRVSLEFKQQIQNEQGDLISEAITQVATISRQKMKPVALPTIVKEMFLT